MTAYLISDVEIRDPAAFQTHRSLAATSIEKFGGRYLVRGGNVAVLEGERRPTTLIIVEFPDLATAQNWYASAEYAQALAVRDKALARSLVLVEGVGTFPATVTTGLESRHQ